MHKQPQEDAQVAGTEVWGPALWRAIHFIALGYPTVPTEADAAAYRAFFESLDKVIPCEVCANNYRRHFAEIPIDGFLLGGRGNGSQTLFDWTVELHNVVDRELGKPGGGDWTTKRAKDALFAGRWTSSQTPDQPTHTHAGLPSGGPAPPPWPVMIVAVALIVASAIAIVALKRSKV